MSRTPRTSAPGGGQHPVGIGVRHPLLSVVKKKVEPAPPVVPDKPHGMPINPAPKAPVTLPVDTAKLSATTTGVLAGKPAVGHVNSGAHTGLTPQERFRRAQVVLDHFGVPPETDSQASVQDLHALATPAQIAERLAHLDPTGELTHYAELSADGAVLRVFKDRDSKQVLDFEINLARESAEPTPAPDGLRARLLAAKNNPKEKPLAGLRVAVDPGHIGGPEWGPQTRKLVQGSGHTVYEGDLNLETAKLLKKQLEALGAQVVLTRSENQPVTSETLKTINVTTYGRLMLRRATTSVWFQDLLARAHNDNELIALFEANDEVKSLFSPARREEYLIEQADLKARIDFLRAAHADITLILHFDAIELYPTEQDPNVAKIYVPGAICSGELSRAEDRIALARHLIKPDEWPASVQLSEALVGKIDEKMHVPPQRTAYDSTQELAPGVFTRNLRLTLQVTDTSLAYVEGFFYGRPAEFSALIDPRQSVVVDGVTYPKRLAQLADALSGGIVTFVKSYN